MNADPDHPGYRNIIYRPQPVADLTYASYSNLTPYGEAGIRWEKEDNKLLMEITVPVGSSATVYVPAHDISEVRESSKRITKGTDHITFLRMENDYAVFNVNSGTYKFTSETSNEL